MDSPKSVSRRLLLSAAGVAVGAAVVPSWAASTHSVVAAELQVEWWRTQILKQSSSIQRMQLDTSNRIHGSGNSKWLFEGRTTVDLWGNTFSVTHWRADIVFHEEFRDGRMVRRAVVDGHERILPNKPLADARQRLLGRFFPVPGPSPTDIAIPSPASSHAFALQRGGSLVFDLDRRLLAVTRLQSHDRNGALRRQMTLSRHEVIAGRAFPKLVRQEHFDQNGRLVSVREIETTSVAINS